MAVRSRWLFGVSVPSGSTQLVVYTVPVERVAVLRTVSFALGSAGPHTISMYAAGPFTVKLIDGFTQNGPGVRHLELWRAFDPGTTLRITSTVATPPFDLTGYGPLLNGAPS